MGDFDRHSNNSAKPNETKKMVIVLALGVVLIGLVAMQFMKRGSPQTAVGAPVGSGVALPPPVLSEEISPQALANMLSDLQNDPTRPLLRPGAANDSALNVAPRNPFRMSRDWLDSLFTPVVTPATAPVLIVEPVQPVRPVATAPVETRPYVPAPRIIVLQASDYKLSGILNGTMAVINGKVVKVGDVVSKARVIEINDSTVRLQAAESPAGPTLVLSMGSVLPD
jgi:hypothetical protein